jgi:hypothetical protein
MIEIFAYLHNYFSTVNKKLLFFSILLSAIGIFINYYFHLNHKITALPQLISMLCWYFIFLLAFLLPYITYSKLSGNALFNNIQSSLLLIIAPLIFAYKMSIVITYPFSTVAELNIYWNQVVYWPIKLLTVSLLLFVVWKVNDSDKTFYGTSTSNFNPKPYFIMLLIMLPVITIASTQADFLHTYPKLKQIPFLTSQSSYSTFYKLLYELSYGTDFLTIELFFRGFLIIAFSKWFGKNCILPMACFYCTIHFGKPMAECISSFFGGLVLGIITYNTRTIWGGLIVHLGIAWMMELGGYLGNKLF